MIVGGIDIGSRSAKALILREDQIEGWEIIPTGPDSEETASAVVSKLLRKLALSLNDIELFVATGYGRINVPFAQKTITEISCHARGAQWQVGQTRTILDMGGQDCKAIKCDERGRVVRFLMNDKCAAGTGRYLERVAGTLHIPLNDMGPLSLLGDPGAVTVNNYCAVFAEMDIVTLTRKGVPTVDILASAIASITKRTLQLLERVGVEDALFISGGVAKNVGVVTRTEERLHMKSVTAAEPQVVGALGAALFARDLAAKTRAA